ncbi:hypothetical protein M885DRAFT_50268 [Pelagophyceae sp. CCMP2097]|nr:hypothetical protein M885DRAFT_50268 [Pelagophyceae sp. CCMP2097]
MADGPDDGDDGLRDKFREKWAGGGGEVVPWSGGAAPEASPSKLRIKAKNSIEVSPKQPLTLSQMEANAAHKKCAPTRRRWRRTRSCNGLKRQQKLDTTKASASRWRERPKRRGWRKSFASRRQRPRRFWNRPLKRRQRRARQRRGWRPSVSRPSRQSIWPRRRPRLRSATARPPRRALWRRAPKRRRRLKRKKHCWRPKLRCPLKRRQKRRPWKRPSF